MFFFTDLTFFFTSRFHLFFKKKIDLFLFPFDNLRFLKKKKTKKKQKKKQQTTNNKIHNKKNIKNKFKKKPTKNTTFIFMIR